MADAIDAFLKGEIDETDLLLQLKPQQAIPKTDAEIDAFLNEGMPAKPAPISPGPTNLYNSGPGGGFLGLKPPAKGSAEDRSQEAAADTIMDNLPMAGATVATIGIPGAGAFTPGVVPFLKFAGKSALQAFMGGAAGGAVESASKGENVATGAIKSGAEQGAADLAGSGLLKGLQVAGAPVARKITSEGAKVLKFATDKGLPANPADIFPTWLNKSVTNVIDNLLPGRYALKKKSAEIANVLTIPPDGANKLVLDAAQVYGKNAPEEIAEQVTESVSAALQKIRPPRGSKVLSEADEAYDAFFKTLGDGFQQKRVDMPVLYDTLNIIETRELSTLGAQQDTAALEFIGEIRKKLMPPADYAISHRPMRDAGGAARLDDLVPSFGEDIYGRDALQFFGSGDKRESAVLKILRGLRGNPDGTVTIYRGVPKDAADSINVGDWVTLDKNVAADYGEKVLSKQVSAKDVTSWPDSLLEFGYFPEGAKAIDNSPGLNGQDLYQMKNRLGKGKLKSMDKRNLGELRDAILTEFENLAKEAGNPGAIKTLQAANATWAAGRKFANHKVVKQIAEGNVNTAELFNKKNLPLLKELEKRLPKEQWNGLMAKNLEDMLNRSANLNGATGVLDGAKLLSVIDKHREMFEAVYPKETLDAIENLGAYAKVHKDSIKRAGADLLSPGATAVSGGLGFARGGVDPSLVVGGMASYGIARALMNPQSPVPLFKWLTGTLEKEGGGSLLARSGLRFAAEDSAYPADARSAQ